MMSGAKTSLRRHPDGLAIASFLAISLILFGLLKPGVSSLHGDNLIQNYPLRVFVGDILSSGHLPLWNPYIWSGTPLLAGFNAGAAYPLTWLFAVLPGPTAWTLTLIAVYTLAASGFYCLMRELGRSWWASWLAGATFGFSGFMIAQMVHLGNVQGVAWVGWISLFVIRVTKSQDWPERLKWTMYLGVSAGLVILTGSPEPMAFGSVFAAITAFYALFSPEAKRGPSLAAFVLAGILALCIGAMQWVPGLAFIHMSQRHKVSLTTFGSMSLPPISWIFFFWPYIHGGYSRFPAPINYKGTFNLPEISGYVGLLPVLAALSLVFSKWNKLDRRQLWMFYTWGIAGALLSAGRFTPLEGILYHIPLYHGIRAQNRNLFMVDAALAAIFAYWLDGIRQRKLFDSGKLSWRVFVPGMIFAALFFLCLRIGITTDPLIIHGLGVYVVIGILLGVIAMGIYFSLPWLSSPRRMQIVTIFTVIDVALFTGGQYWLNPPSINVATGGPSLSTRMTAIVGTGGRYGIYDPNLTYYPQVEALNEPDLNLLYGLKSFQGYGSLVSGRYQKATGSHRQAVFKPSLLASDPLVNKLNVTTVFTLPEDLLKAVSANAPWSQMRLRPHSGLPNLRHPWFFGTKLNVRTVRLNFPVGIGLPSRSWHVGSLLSSGKIKWYRPFISRAGNVLSLNFPSGVHATAIVIRAPQGFTGQPQGAVIAAGKPAAIQLLVPNQALTGSLPFPQWRYEGQVGSFALFHNTRAHGWFWLGNQGNVEPFHPASPIDPNHVTVRVSAPGATRLHWSESYAPGWTATITHNGTTRTAKVSPGVIQSVKVPKGLSRVSFRYQEPGLDPGIFLSVAGFLAALAIWIVARRRDHA